MRPRLRQRVRDSRQGPVERGPVRWRAPRIAAAVGSKHPLTRPRWRRWGRCDGRVAVGAHGRSRQCPPVHDGRLYGGTDPLRDPGRVGRPGRSGAAPGSAQVRMSQSPIVTRRRAGAGGRFRSLSAVHGLLQGQVTLGGGPAQASADHLEVEGSDGREGGSDLRGGAFGFELRWHLVLSHEPPQLLKHRLGQIRRQVHRQEQGVVVTHSTDPIPARRHHRLAGPAEPSAGPATAGRCGPGAG